MTATSAGPHRSMSMMSKDLFHVVLDRNVSPTSEPRLELGRAMSIALRCYLANRSSSVEDHASCRPHPWN